ncbi:hypothetical protein [Natrarchaeobius chitinivorans]|uniref:hypothetical protein n=1 Tax=Natrarchaeobius chitinivorans TaxID=1679083 RepID=UPI001FB31FDA|nr:hypothetical protein [Natrarchaeobius chitinivorans]
MGDDDEAVFVDSSILISCGRRESTRFRALGREADRRGTIFRIPPQVYAEMGGETLLEGYATTDSAVDEALRDGWMSVTESPSYSEPDVSYGLL